MRRLNGQMLTVTPFLWIQHPVDEAATFYADRADDELRDALRRAGADTETIDLAVPYAP